VELLVVDKSDGGGQTSASRDFIQIFDTDLEVREDNRGVLLNLRDQSHPDNSLSDDTKVTLVAHNDVVEVGSGGDTRPFACLHVGAL